MPNKEQSRRHEDYPKDNFEIVVDDARGFFEDCMTSFIQHKDVFFQASGNVFFDASLFDKEFTNVYFFREKKKRPTQMQISTSLYLSESGQKLTNGGSFTLNYVHEVRNALETRGITSEIATTESEYLMRITMNDMEMGVSFPKVGNDHPELRAISLGLLEMSEETSISGQSTNRFPYATDDVQFEQLMEAYALLYTKVVNAIHDVERIHIFPQTAYICSRKADNDDSNSGFSENNADDDEEQNFEHNQLEPRTRKLDFSDIIGQDEAVEQAKYLVEIINSNHKIPSFARVNGVLLVGEPGVGKTLLTKIISDQVDAELVSIETDKIVNMYYGNSEKFLQAKFDEAYMAADQGRKVIILMDEFDSLFQKRSDAHEATVRLVSVYLKNMGNIKSNPNIIFIGATNRKTAIDPAVIRAGRIDLIIEMGTFDTPEKRLEIFKFYRDKGQEEVEYPLFDENVDWDYIAEVSDGISIGMNGRPITNGADVVNVLSRAYSKNNRKSLKIGVWQPITTQDIVDAINAEQTSRSGEGLIQKKPLGFDTLGSKTTLKKKSSR